MKDRKCPEERTHKSDMLLSLLLSEVCSCFIHLTLQVVKKKKENNQKPHPKNLCTCLILQNF